MALLAGETFTLASRDSLLALAQSIEAALLLRSHGAEVKILTLKTSGDIKLDAPLYDVAAAAAPKEGRAFFTRELDDALQNGKADIAVHSFKDLPTEPVAGVSDPIFFSEQTGADILVTLKHAAQARQIIGTSSLRRIHQLQHALPEATTVTLRGNIVTRLRKLRQGEAGMNAILIAGAGIFRVRNFAKLAPEAYANLLESTIAEKVARELGEFTEYLDDGVTIQELDETVFPTAPGQGVLALQMSAACEQRLGRKLRALFKSHAHIAKRVGLERQLMTALGTGCHAPLGVSALRAGNGLQVTVCYSRKSQTSPPAFFDSVFLRRNTREDAGPLVAEAKHGFERFFWWGLSEPPAAHSEKWTFVRALKQNLLHPHFDETAQYGHIFVSSKTAADWLKASPIRGKVNLWAAGEETAKYLALAFAGSRVESCAEKGFGAAYSRMRGENKERVLWLGSASGLGRAQAIAAIDSEIDFLCVYENLPAEPEALTADYTALGQAVSQNTALHCLTSRASAEAFIRFAKLASAPKANISCFGESAAECVETAGYRIYHKSNAASFTEYLREIEGDTALMRIEEENTK